MIIFWPKKETSPLLSLNRTWFTDPTSLRRSHAFGLPFGLVCTGWYLLDFFCQQFERLQEFRLEQRSQFFSNLDRVLDPDSWRNHVQGEKRRFPKRLSQKHHYGCSEEVLLVDSRDEDQCVAATHR